MDDRISAPHVAPSRRPTMTCPNCQVGYTTACQHREWMTGAQSEVLRVPLATFVATPETPPDHLTPSLLTLSDVMATG